MMNKIIKQLKFIMLLLVGITSISGTAQEYVPTSPSVSALAKFDAHPVDLPTGTPNISIPLTYLPTLSKDIRVDFDLKYHPSSIAVYDTLSGNTGRGWSLYNSGVISFNGKGGGHFNFMGYTGSISVKSEGMNQYTTYISEKNGAILKANVEVDPNDFLNYISATIYDDNGIKYVFDLADNYVKVKRGGQPGATWETRNVTNSALHLTKVIDNNNGILLTFNYETFYKEEDYHQGNEKNTYRHLKEVISHSVGKVTLEHSLVNTTAYDPKIKYTSLTLRDVQNNQINKFRFIYNDQNLIELIQDNNDNTQTIKHQFFYKGPAINQYNHIADVDKWGNNNEFDKWCMYANDWRINIFYEIVYDRTEESKALSPRHVAKGVLQKIIYPTGGAVLYDYEANTYSYANIHRFEQRPIPNSDPLEWEHDPDFFTSFTTANLHNFSKSSFAGGSFTPGGATSFSFTVLNSPKKLYFKFDIDQFEQQMDLVDSSEDDPTMMSFYPQFSLRQSSTIIETFGFGKSVITNAGTPDPPIWKYKREYYNNNQNCCSGQSITLNPGTYQIHLNSSYPHNGYATVEEIAPVTSQKKWHYGNGIRIKRIGYFEDPNVPQNYYSLSNPGVTYTPVKEINYDYSLFDEPNRSSGYLLVDGIVNYEVFAKKAVYKDGISPIWYQNVRVAQTGEAGRTDYYFLSPKDFTSENTYTSQPSSSTKYGKAKEIRIYNESGVLQKKIENLYNYEEEYLSDPPEGVINKFSYGWTALMQAKETSYFASSNPAEITSNYTYVLDRLVATKTETSSVSNENLTTKYYYHLLNTPTNLNRIALEKTEVFLNTTLLNTTFINYSNQWPVVNYGGFLGIPNISYQAQSTSVSKHDNPLVQKMKVNLIDSNSNPVEIEQENGIKVSYIWGYNSTQVVAKIENMAFNSIPPNLITPIIDASNTNNSANLITALNALRNHSSMANAMVSTFTYKPLVGIKTMTDPKGYTTTYHYDNFNRLEKVTDMQGNILSENQYHYRTQN